MTRYSPLIAFISRYRLPVYVFIAFLWSWVWWIPATLVFKGALAPLFWLPGGAAISGPAVTVYAALWYLAYLIGWSILFTWMYNNTCGSVLLAVLLHGSLNAGSVLTLFPDLPFSTRRNLLFLTIIPLAAGIAALLFGSKRLSKHRDGGRLSLHAQREKESAR